MLLNWVCAFAQSFTGSLAGVVTDPTDAASSKAAVVPPLNAMGAERTADTNEAGPFFLGSLQPGRTRCRLRRLEGQVSDSVVVEVQAAVVQWQPAGRAEVLMGP